jgi:hypothetical protein
MERTGSGIGETLASRIMYAGSKIRLNNARYLVYSIVDAIVDEVSQTELIVIVSIIILRVH